jgi:MFS family permease
LFGAILRGNKMASNVAVVPEASVESSASGVHWGAIVAGAVGAVGITIILISLGPGLGLTTVSPWAPSATPPATFGIAAGIWLIITQWLSAGLGGYLAGRLREKWVGVRTDEILFRDTAHGLLAWALATIIVVVLLIAGSALAGAAAAASSTPAAPVSPEAAEAARKAAISFSFFSSLSFLIGAFIGAVAGALGGYHRDEI